MMTELNVTLSQAWKGFFEEKARYRVAHGGRGSGKSFTMAMILVVQSISRPMRILCIRALQKSIKDSSMQLVKDAIDFLNVGYLFDVGQGYIRHKTNGSEFIFTGLKYNADSIKSTQGVDIAWIDEADTTTEKQFVALTPTVRNENSEIWISFNPQSEDDYLYSRFISGKSDIAIVREFNYTENKWFPEVLEQERLDCLNNYPDLYDHIWLGKTLDVSDACYYSAALKQIKGRDQIGAISWDSSYPVTTYWDIGYSDYTSIWFLQKVGTQMRLIDFEQNNGEHPAYYGELLSDKPYNYHAHYLPHDAKHVRFGMTQSISQQLIDAGLKGIIGYTQQGRGISDIQATRLFLNRCFFNADTTVEGIKMLKNYKRQFDDKRNVYSDKPIHDWASHGADAFRYLAMHNINERDIVTTSPHSHKIHPQIKVNNAVRYI